MKAVETRTYKLTAGHYMNRMFRMYLADKWWILLVIVAPFIGLSFINLNFIYVALIVVFLVLPMLSFFVWFSYAFDTECLSAIRKGTMRVDEDGLTRFFMDGDGNRTGERRYQWDEFDEFEVVSGEIVLYYRTKRYAFQVIPVDSFENRENKELAISLISKGIGVEEEY